jgi:hypothetical protein
MKLISYAVISILAVWSLRTEAAQPVGTSAFKSRECGVSFRVLSGWRVAPLPDLGFVGPEGVRCAFGLTPATYQAAIDSSHWSHGEAAIELIVFSVPFNKALDLMDFDRDASGKIHVSGGYGSVSPAIPFAFRGLEGFEAHIFFRGFLKDSAVEEDRRNPGSTGEGEVGVFSDWIRKLVLHDQAGRSIGMTIETDDPDQTLLPLKIGAGVNTVLQSLRLR